jgi:hypothetical protein
LVDNNALKVLVGLLRQEDNRETTHRYAAIALCDLMTGQSIYRTSYFCAYLYKPLRLLIFSYNISVNKIRVRLRLWS